MRHFGEQFRVSVPFFHGGLNQEQRADIVRRFQTDHGPKVLVLSADVIHFDDGDDMADDDFGCTAWGRDWVRLAQCGLLSSVAATHRCPASRWRRCPGRRRRRLLLPGWHWALYPRAGHLLRNGTTCR
ncbi:hypothetical protein AB0I68_14125 [Streptomyces sp. NPDC050448]|uniref:hypothetical protein n=1 Tax=Streptomyces sp. NPDC050448 TaxID=3155404 RepID=UPI00343A3C03